MVAPFERTEQNSAYTPPRKHDRRRFQQRGRRRIFLFTCRLEVFVGPHCM